MYMALTAAIAKFEKQAVKLKNKNHRSKAERKKGFCRGSGTDGAWKHRRGARIIAARRYTVKPMTAERQLFV